MNETSLKSFYNKVPRRMKHIMLKFFANVGRVRFINMCLL